MTVSKGWLLARKLAALFPMAVAIKGVKPTEYLTWLLACPTWDSWMDGQWMLGMRMRWPLFLMYMRSRKGKGTRVHWAGSQCSGLLVSWVQCGSSNLYWVTCHTLLGIHIWCSDPLKHFMVYNPWQNHRILHQIFPELFKTHMYSHQDLINCSFYRVEAWGLYFLRPPGDFVL